MRKKILPSISFHGTLSIAPVPVSAQRGHLSNPAGGPMGGPGAGGAASAAHGDHAGNASTKSSGKTASEIFTRHTKLSSKISILTGGNSLGMSIQALDPKANSTTETKKAQKQANDHLNESES